ncbi:MAG TPA: gliding motility-associated ABC transporter ATP-binding subunit GldA [Parasegetibacter sp.]|jgi:ABC-2 type transport system ATP-binding protein
MSIEVKALTKVYGEQTAVDQVSFSVSKGEIVGFLGPNGAGKSTTMKMITGYLEPDDGEIFVCGMPVARQPLGTKSRIGYLPESNALYYDMYVREYLSFIAGIHQLKNAKSRIQEVIETVGLTREANKKTGQLSKGYKQRVGLAAALIHDPEVLILDEPTSGLDPNQILEIREVIKHLGKTKTILFSSHILQEVEALCERVIIISKGKMVADASLEELRRRETTDTLHVKFQEALEQEWLQRLPAVISAEKTDSFTWELKTSDAGLLRQQLMELALQHKLNIVSLQSGSSNLEEIFRELTN